MSWTTVCDLTMESYQGNQALDSTEFHNDADLLGNLTTYSGYVTFQGPDAQLEVPLRDDSLARFAGLRVQVLVHPDGAAHRYNLVEGWMSFAFFIEPDGRLVGTIYDGANWVATESSPNTIIPDTSARVMFEYDGVSIARLTLDGATVGRRFDMPHVLYQPQQVIALGHWPRGDGRYTLQGKLGHVRIERRDYQDISRDALQTALCRRRLTSRQADALCEIQYLMTTLDPRTQERLREGAITVAERMRAFIHDLRTMTPRGGSQLQLLGDQLRNAWCCSFNAPAVRQALLEYMRAVGGEPGTRERERLHAMVEEFLSISRICDGEGYPYDRLRELNLILFPELRSFEMDLRQLVEAI